MAPHEDDDKAGDARCSPAQIDWSDPSHPRCARFGDVYASCAGAVAQARAVFLAGNGLPARWAARSDFVLLETGFGLGTNFLATWQAWAADPARCSRLHYLAVEAFPPSADDLQRAHAGSELAALARELIAQWPPCVSGQHRLRLAGGGVQLTLVFGDIRRSLPQLQAQVDACYLDGFAPHLNPAMWSERALAPLARLAAPGATAATWSVARPVREALSAAGFGVERVAGFGGKAQRLQAVHAARHRPEPPPGLRPLAPGARRALVLGAGLAGAACADALRHAGLEVTVIDAAGPAAAASGNPGGLFHATVHPDDGAHARWSRAAALHLARLLPDIALPWRCQGLLRLAPGETVERLQALAARHALPSDFVQALDAEAVRRLSHLPLDAPGWLYPSGGALPPAALVAHWLQGIETRLAAVARVQALSEGWAVLDAAGQEIDRAPLLVLAAGAALPSLLAPLAPALAASLRAQRGQISQFDAALAAQAARPALPVAGGGYVLPLPEGALLAGATTQFDDPDPQLRAADQAVNAAVWQRLCGAPSGLLPCGGRVGWRLLAADRLPLIGGLPDETAPPPRRAAQSWSWPRRSGLLVCGALASRGITSAALAGEVAAALALGLPSPVERALLEAVDPARFLARSARRASAPPLSAP